MDSQESCPEPQYESINSWALSLLMVQLSHSYMTTGKAVALTIWTFVSKVVSLLFNTPSRFVIAFLPKGKCLLISWLQSLSTEILEPKKNKICHCFHYVSRILFNQIEDIFKETVGSHFSLFIYRVMSSTLPLPSSVTF